MKDRTIEALAVGFVYGLALLFVISLWVGKSHFEARAFNRVTGKDVSTWDAMFLQLRVASNDRLDS